MKTWEDKTGRSYGEKDRTPKTWELNTNKLRIIVTRHMDYAEDDWCARCYDIGMDLVRLKSKDIDAAKKEAIELVSFRLKQMLASLEQEKVA
jgi:hypothetical protein